MLIVESLNFVFIHMILLVLHCLLINFRIVRVCLSAAFFYIVYFLIFY